MKIREQQRRELGQTLHPPAEADTEDDMVSSMEYDETLDRDEEYEDKKKDIRENGGENKMAICQSIGDSITFLKRNAKFHKNDQDQEHGTCLKRNTDIQKHHDQQPEEQISGSDFKVQGKVEPRPFLKRGSGLARFKLSTDLAQLPCRVRRRQPNVTRIQSRYTEDTQAFDNR